MVRLRTDAGLTGLGEASDAFGFANTTNQDAARMESELRAFFGLIDGKSPLDVAQYREKGEPLALKGGLVSATAYSAIEPALWDLAGSPLDLPTCHVLLADACAIGCPLRQHQPARAAADAGGFRRRREGGRARRLPRREGGAVRRVPAPASPAATDRSGCGSRRIASMAAIREARSPAGRGDTPSTATVSSAWRSPSARRPPPRPQQLAWYGSRWRREDRRDARHPPQDSAADGRRRVLFGVGDSRRSPATGPST